MTRRQVRAAMRRLRTQYEEVDEEAGELNLVPYMDIVTNIIIFLLASVATQMPIGNVNVSAPTLGSGGGSIEEKKEEPLNLTVTVGQTGFTIAASGGVMAPILKKPNGQHDFKALTEKLVEIKKQVAASETKATFNADAVTPYELVIQTLDAMRQDATGSPLFPDVIFSAGIL